MDRTIDSFVFIAVAGGDVDGDGVADVLTGAGAGGGPHVRAGGGPHVKVFSGATASDPDTAPTLSADDWL